MPTPSSSMKSDASSRIVLHTGTSGGSRVGDSTASSHVLHPHSGFRVYWDVFSMAFLLYNVIVVPLRLCFDANNECPHGLWIIESLIDWFFVVDIILNFSTAGLGSHRWQLPGFRAGGSECRAHAERVDAERPRRAVATLCARPAAAVWRAARRDVAHAAAHPAVGVGLLG